ncbi:hypothetical protein [Paracraurococcus ruber]|uniref:Tyr recombinase domain-containing protein n=1 Tax=Paracraurococcus ruber TaxID=77675 RepID=A0ABS1D003_9PROT|nr:hypothetical protein [Paracraurococcus ruber]MBK1659853.1 hypothetical protein [Paracraurococcus ruber]TDG28953.1 hypothetical protein E2C05_19070 [Paracraurococcus ruber]
MTTFDAAQLALFSGADVVGNLADLAARIREWPDLPVQQRRAFLSALNTLARATGRPLAALPVAPAPLRAILNDLTPAAAGISAASWNNVRSLLRRALALTGVALPAGPSRDARSEAWQALTDGLPDFRARHHLTRLSRHCSRAGIAPAEVDDAVLDRFLAHLEADPLVARPRSIHRDAIREWNRHAGVLPGWPSRVLAPPDRRKGRVLPQDAIPAALAADIAAWRSRLAGENLLAERDFRPLRATSLATRERQVRALLGALARDGFDLTTLRGLTDLVVPETAARALTVLLREAGGEPTFHTGQVAGLLCAIARHHADASPAQVAQLDRIRRRVTPPASGLTPRNRTRLRAFDDPRRLQAFLALPQNIREEVRRAGRPTRALARRLRTAVAMEVLLMAPIRLRNLRSLQLGANLLRGTDGTLTIVLEQHDTKNRLVFEAVLPAESCELIELYLARYQPLLCQRPCCWLFPDEGGDGPMSDDGLRQSLMTLAHDRCGVVVNPHLYRHLAAKIILDRQPGAYGLVRLTLVHQTVATTTSSYAGTETQAAVRHYDRMVQQAREKTPAAVPRRRGSERRRA